MFKEYRTYAAHLIIAVGIFVSCSIIYVEKVVLADVRVTATVNGICGDDSINAPGEQCDGIDLSGKSCLTLGYAQGNLVCHTDCTAFIVSDCSGVAPIPVSSGGGGGGGSGGGSSTSAATNVILSGIAYPGAKVTVIKNTKIIASGLAGPDARFEFSVSNLSSGSYVFNVYSEDAYGLKSPPYVFPVSLTTGITAKVTGIFLAPTITADKVQVKKGDVIRLLGHASPNAEVSIVVNSEEPHFFKTISDTTGKFLQNIDTSFLEYGDHNASLRAAANNEISPDSYKYEFKVGVKNIENDIKELNCPKEKMGDFNCDGKINLVDYSIITFWYQKTGALPNIDLNGDGKVNLVDYSIMAFNWTG